VHTLLLLLQGAKIGVLGANGAGKSSLMRILAGEDTSFDGRVVRAPGIRWERGLCYTCIRVCGFVALCMA
jgi:ATPase subunit of ABC transporter with duplicated ATPase domains